jgi:membrane protein DedA with SNARE-associated domain
MHDLVSQMLAHLSRGESALGVAVLAAASLVEYVFPPFPGDTVTVFGAFLAATARWHVAVVLVAVTAGSLAGAAIDYAVGTRLAARPDAVLSRRRQRVRDRIAPLVARFERHGAAYLLANRFLPGIRALIFVAAGAARLPLGRVLACGAISALLWNGLLIGAGYAVEENWGLLLDLVRRYTATVWIALGVAAIGFAAVSFRRRARRSGKR